MSPWPCPGGNYKRKNQGEKRYSGKENRGESCEKYQSHAKILNSKLQR